MPRRERWRWGLLAAVVLGLLAGCQSRSGTVPAGAPLMQVHYIEIVSAAVERQCEALEQVHGLSFGPEDPDLGGARVAEAGNGVLIGVRGPLAAHETPIVRTYYAVDDIAKTVDAAEAAGAMIAYGPVRQGETGTWAIYILEGIQYGLWQQ